MLGMYVRLHYTSNCNLLLLVVTLPQNVACEPDRPLEYWTENIMSAS